MPTNWQEQCEKPMKLPSESVVLGVVAFLAVIVICLAGFSWEYGWFVTSRTEEPLVEISHGFSSGEGPQKSPKINVNTATVSQLQQLPGVGEALARAIVQYREEHGKFTEISQLLEVEGMSQDTLIFMNPYLTFE